MKKKWILHHCDLNLWLKVTDLNRNRSSAACNYLVSAFSLCFLFSFSLSFFLSFPLSFVFTFFISISFYFFLSFFLSFCTYSFRCFPFQKWHPYFIFAVWRMCRLITLSGSWNSIKLEKHLFSTWNWNLAIDCIHWFNNSMEIMSVTGFKFW